MDTPKYDTEWLLRIDDAVNAEEERRSKASTPAPGPSSPTIG